MTHQEISKAPQSEADKNLFRSRLASIAHLITGSFAVSAVMALSTVVAARALGPEAYGVLALVLTIGRICERFIRFESWQPVIRYGTQKDVEGNPEAMGRLFLLGLLLDIGCALLAGVVMLVGGFFILPYIGLEQSDFYLLAIFAPAIALNITGVPTAALRLADQFRLLAYFQLFSATLRLGMAGIAWAMDAPLGIFLAIWTLAQIINTVVFGFLTKRALEGMGIANPLTAGVKGLLDRFPGFMGFAWSTNLSSSLRTLTHEVDTLLVGAFAGPVAAGSYHIAKRFAKVAQQVAAHVQAVIYPDMSRMWANDRYSEVRAMKAKIQLCLGAIGFAATIAVVAIGRPGIALLFGEGFDLVYPMLVAQLIAVTCIMIGAPTRSTMLAMNRAGTVLKIAVLAAITFFAIAWATLSHVGAIGANYAHIGAAAVTVILLEITFRSAYKSDHSVETKGL